MMTDGGKRRFLCLWLPRWPTDRWWRRHLAGPGQNARPAEDGTRRPLLLVRSGGGRRLVHAADDAALALGLSPGQRLADALARVPAARVEPADPAGDLAALHQLAQWATRFSPHVAPDAPDALLLDITGCGHLWQGEEKLMADALSRLGAQGFHARGAIAGTIGAATACARFGGSGAVIPAGSISTALGRLPVQALRLDCAMAAGLERVGLRRIGDLYPLSRADLSRRFGRQLLERLDQALGCAPESLSPLAPRADHRVSLVFAEPVLQAEAVERAAGILLERLLRELGERGLGVRRLGLVAHRLDEAAPGCIIGTARPSLDARHLLLLIAAKIGEIDPGPGIERMSLSALVTEKLVPAQSGFIGVGADAGLDEAGLAQLVDRLAGRFGADALRSARPVGSHVPERAVMMAPSLQEAGRGAGSGNGGDDGWREALPPRPIRLLSPPEPVDALAPVPDDPPLSFRWRHVLHRVARAEGPERIRPEWWQESDDGRETRDYYRVEVEDGRRFWLFRSGLYRPGPGPGAGAQPRWFLHGIFA